jgi:hypothetical protein
MVKQTGIFSVRLSNNGTITGSASRAPQNVTAIDEAVAIVGADL